MSAPGLTGFPGGVWRLGHRAEPDGTRQELIHQAHIRRVQEETG